MIYCFLLLIGFVCGILAGLKASPKVEGCAPISSAESVCRCTTGVAFNAARLYPDEQTARRLINEMEHYALTEWHGRRLYAYKCPTSDGWHIKAKTRIEAQKEKGRVELLTYNDIYISAEDFRVLGLSTRDALNKILRLRPDMRELRARVIAEQGARCAISGEPLFVDGSPGSGAQAPELDHKWTVNDAAISVDIGEMSFGDAYKKAVGEK